jgi:hypothetical protein
MSTNWRDTYANQPPYVGYDDYVDPTRPDPANYLENPEQYDADMAIWAAGRNGERAFAPPTATPYTRDDGSQGNWYTAGTTREETGGEYWANYLNNKWLRNGGNPTGLNYIGLKSWLSLHPEEAQAALMAVDAGTGTPLLDRGLIDWMLERGMRMPDPPAAPPPNLNEDTGIPDAGRWGTWWNTPPNLNEDTAPPDAARRGEWWTTQPAPGAPPGAPPNVPPVENPGVPGTTPIARPMYGMGPTEGPQATPQFDTRQALERWFARRRGVRRPMQEL